MRRRNCDVSGHFGLRQPTRPARPSGPALARASTARRAGPARSAARGCRRRWRTPYSSSRPCRTLVGSTRRRSRWRPGHSRTRSPPVQHGDPQVPVGQRAVRQGGQVEGGLGAPAGPVGGQRGGAALQHAGRSRSRTSTSAVKRLGRRAGEQVVDPQPQPGARASASRSNASMRSGSSAIGTASALQR